MIADKDSRPFKVGDGCHWGFNGDAYPGTVVKVSASGRKVWVSRDSYRVERGGFSDEDQVFFTTVDCPADQLDCYSLRKNGHFHRAGFRGYGTAWSLRPGRAYSWNPSF